MEEFLRDPSKQTPEAAMAIITDPLYKEFKKTLSAKEALQHPVFLEFVRKSTDVLGPAVTAKFRAMLPDSAKE
jgi:hypothetical protein